MSSTLPPSEPEAPPDDAADDTEFYSEIVDELIQMGVDLARQILQEAATLGACAVTIAFERVNRTIRRGTLLALKLIETRRAPGRNARNRSEARARIRAEVQDAIDRNPPESVADTADHAPADRLDSIGTGTVPEIIAALCHDLASVATTLGKPVQRRLRLTAVTRARTRPGNSQAKRTTAPCQARSRGSG